MTIKSHYGLLIAPTGAPTVFFLNQKLMKVAKEPGKSIYMKPKS